MTANLANEKGANGCSGLAPLDRRIMAREEQAIVAARFDAGRGHAFASFAIPHDHGELKRHIRDRTWTVRPPRGVQEMTLRVQSAAARLSQQGNRAPTVPDAAAVGASVTKRF